MPADRNPSTTLHSPGGVGGQASPHSMSGYRR